MSTRGTGERRATAVAHRSPENGRPGKMMVYSGGNVCLVYTADGFKCLLSCEAQVKALQHPFVPHARQVRSCSSLLGGPLTPWSDENAAVRKLFDWAPVMRIVAKVHRANGLGSRRHWLLDVCSDA